MLIAKEALLIYFKFIYICMHYMCLLICMCTIYMQCLKRPKRAPDSLVPECCQVGGWVPRTKSMSFGRAASALTCWAISPVLALFILKTGIKGLGYSTSKNEGLVFDIKQRKDKGRAEGRGLHWEYFFSIRLEVNILFIHSTSIYRHLLCAKLAFLLTKEVI